MTVRWLRGDCREQMVGLDAGSIQTVITSPPYWGLRDYGLPPLVWGGEAVHNHEWSAAAGRWSTGGAKPDFTGFSPGHGTRQGEHRVRGLGMGEFCACGAWLGSLGLEPAPELYVEHLVEVFRCVRRVLRDDGTLWLNLGDSYAGSGKGPTGHNGIGNQSKRQGFTGGPRHRGDAARAKADDLIDQNPEAVGRLRDKLQRIGPQEHTNGSGRVAGFKPKDLMMIPARVAIALQADGWYLRSQIPWLKRSGMPESVNDRPATAVEYVYLFGKRRDYYWDAAAVRVDGHVWPGLESTFKRAHSKRSVALVPGQPATHRPDRSNEPLPPGRNRRNSDWFFESWQGLVVDEEGDPLAFVVNPRPFRGAHFATFPPQLVEPMIKAATHPGDTVLDPFGGAGTVGLVAERLDRFAVVCELKPEYSDMGVDRIVGDSPMFNEVVA